MVKKEMEAEKEKKEKRIIGKLKSIKIDKTDALFYVGLLMLGGGLCIKALWLGLCVVGSILVVVAVLGAGFRK